MTDRSDYFRDMPAPACVGEGAEPAFRAVTDEDHARWDAVDQQRVTLDQAREEVAKRTAMLADMQPERLSYAALERRCAQLEREASVYQRALAQIIAVHMLEKP